MNAIGPYRNCHKRGESSTDRCIVWFAGARGRWTWRCFGWILLLGSFALLEGTSYAQDTAPPPSAAPVSDAGAAAFLRACAGCHTIGGGALSGPDLKPASAWPRNNLLDAIRRMEKNVGPLTDEKVNVFADLLASADAAARIKSEQDHLALQQTAKLSPASAAIGEQLFLGHRSFSNGGPACVACHQAKGRGGNLAIALEDAFTRLGEAPILSTCENPGFPVMRAVYGAHPVSKQEATHLVKYLETVSQTPAARRMVPIEGVGFVAAMGFLALAGRGYRDRLRGTRARLVKSARFPGGTGRNPRRIPS